MQLLLDAAQTATKPKKAKGKEKESDEPSPRLQAARPPVSRACDVGARNWWHWSPLHFAGTVPTLPRRGPLHPTRGLTSFLWRAASAGHEEVVRLLCQAPGAIDSACVVSSNGIVNTARQMAADRQLNRILSLLCAYAPSPLSALRC